MKSVAKKAIIYSMIGLLQVGMFSSVAAAAPASVHNDGPRQMAYHERDDRHDRDGEQRRKQEEQKRKYNEHKRQENERHKREMKRLPFENEHQWRERQKQEEVRHNNELRQIAALLIGIAIGSAN